MRIFLEILSLLTFAAIAVSENKLDVEFEWKYVDYVYDSPEQEKVLLDTGAFVKGTPYLLDVDKAAGVDGKIFVTSVREKGVPASLLTVTKQIGDGGPLLKPYPNWGMSNVNLTNCDAITNVYRVAIDDCNNLWAVDCGQISGEQICPPKIFVFDLSTDTLIKKIDIDEKLLKGASGSFLLVNIQLEVRDESCHDVTAYLADVEGYGMIVWEAGKAWRIENPAFNPDPAATTFTILNESFSFSDGLLGMALTNPTDRWNLGSTMYLRAFASFDLYSALTQELRHLNNASIDVQKLGTLPSQAVALGYCKGVLYFALVEQTSIACWNTATSLSSETIGIIEMNTQDLQFPGAMKIKKGCKGHKLWTLSNRLQKIMNGELNSSEVNFRVLTGYIDYLIENTVCVQTS